MIAEASAVQSTRDVDKRHCRLSHHFVSVFALLVLSGFLAPSTFSEGNLWGKANTPFVFPVVCLR